MWVTSIFWKFEPFRPLWATEHETPRFYLIPGDPKLPRYKQESYATLTKRDNHQPPSKNVHRHRWCINMTSTTNPTTLHPSDWRGWSQLHSDGSIPAFQHTSMTRQKQPSKLLIIGAIPLLSTPDHCSNVTNLALTAELDHVASDNCGHKTKTTSPWDPLYRSNQKTLRNQQCEK